VPTVVPRGWFSATLLFDSVMHVAASGLMFSAPIVKPMV
jgi:hypothetical protein